MPTDITLSSSYRNIQSQFYLLPEGDSLNGYSDLDIAYMKSSKSDETHFYGNTRYDSIRIIHYNRPSEQFTQASVLPLSHIIQHNGAYNFYDTHDSLIIDRPLDSVKTGIRGEGSGIDSTKISFQDGKIYYLNGNTKIIIDTVYKSIFHEERDSTGIWIKRRYKQFHATDTNIQVPIYRLSTHRILLPSGKCAFMVTQQTSHEIYYPGSDSAMTGIGSGSFVSTETNEDIRIVSAKVFPNPAYDILNIAIMNENIEEGSVQIISPDGRIIINEKFNLLNRRNVLNFNIGGLNHGLYLVRIISNDGITSISKFIKQ